MSPSHRLGKYRSWIASAVVVLLFVLSGVLLAYLLRGMDWELVQRATPGTFLLVLVVSMLGTLVYTLLIYLLIRGSGYVTTLWRAYLVLTASLSVNYVTPVKMGIPLRIYLYNHFMDIPIAIGTALVTVETLVGVLTPACIAVVGIALLFHSVSPVPPLILLALMGIGLLFLLRARFECWQPALERVPFARLLKRLMRFVVRVQSGLRCLSPAVILSVVILDLLMFGLQTVRLWLVLRVFGSAPSPWLLLAVLTISVTAGNLSMIPMGLGVRDASFVLLLAQLGVPNEVALSVGVIQRLFSPGWPLLLGLISTNVLGVREIIQASRESSCAGDELG